MQSSVRQNRAKQISVLTKQLSDQEAVLRKRDRNRTREETRAKMDRITKIKERIAQIENGEVVIPGLDLMSPKVGAVGTISDTVRVAQVIDETKMHVIPRERRTRISFQGVVASQSFYTADGERLIIKGVSTAGLADNSEFGGTQTFEVTGTESYVWRSEQR